MIDAVAVTGSQHAPVVGEARHLGKKLGNLDAALTVSVKGLDRREERIAGDFAPGHDLAVGIGQRLSGAFREFGFRIPEIDVARPTVHEEVDDAFRLRGEMGATHGTETTLGQQWCQREQSETSARLAEKVAAIRQGRSGEHVRDRRDFQASRQDRSAAHSG
jgi:hypothetical protein